MKLSVVNTLLLFAILVYLIVSGIPGINQKKQAYVVTTQLFGEFEYQKELDFELEQIKNQRTYELSLMEADLIDLEAMIRQNTATATDFQNYEIGVARYKQREYEISEELAEIDNEYARKVWDKLNALVKSFGDENGFEVIFGANGSGNIMYAQDEQNITESLIEYCNSKYQGK